jgi:hypothetical protein
LAAFDDTHALAATAGAGLDEDRIANGIGFAAQMICILIVAVIAGHERNTSAGHQRLGRGL